MAQPDLGAMTIAPADQQALPLQRLDHSGIGDRLQFRRAQRLAERDHFEQPPFGDVEASKSGFDQLDESL
jgi:hypothetical protein